MLVYLFLLLVQVNCNKILLPIQHNHTNQKKNLMGTILSNPRKFVESTANLDPVAVEEIITLLNKLKQTSEEAEQELLDTLNAKSEEAIITGNAVADAQTAVDDANTAVEEANGHLVIKESELAAAKATHDAKVGEKNDAQKAHDDQQPGLQNEQDVIDQVIEMLRGVKDSLAPTQAPTPRECGSLLTGSMGVTTYSTGWAKPASELSFGAGGLVGHMWVKLDIYTDYSTPVTIHCVKTDYTRHPFQVQWSDDGSSWTNGPVVQQEEFVLDSPVTTRFARMIWQNTDGSNGFHAQFQGVQ